MEDAGRTLHLHLFSFPPSFPDGRGFCSARREQYADVAQSVRAPRVVDIVGSIPTVCTRGRVAPGQCETVVVMAHMEMTMLAENCTVGGKDDTLLICRLSEEQRIRQFSEE